MSIFSKIEGYGELAVEAIPIVKAAVLAAEVPGATGPQKLEAATQIALAGIQSIAPDIAAKVGVPAVTSFVTKWIPIFVELFNFAQVFLHASPPASPPAA